MSENNFLNHFKSINKLSCLVFIKNKVKKVVGKFRKNQTGTFDSKSKYECQGPDASPNKESIDRILCFVLN
jgi:hypothetical protein